MSLTNTLVIVLAVCLFSVAGCLLRKGEASGRATSKSRALSLGFSDTDLETWRLAVSLSEEHWRNTATIRSNISKVKLLETGWERKYYDYSLHEVFGQDVATIARPHFWKELNWFRNLVEQERISQLTSVGPGISQPPIADYLHLWKAINEKVSQVNEARINALSYQEYWAMISALYYCFTGIGRELNNSPSPFDAFTVQEYEYYGSIEEYQKAVEAVGSDPIQNDVFDVGLLRAMAKSTPGVCFPFPYHHSGNHGRSESWHLQALLHLHPWTCPVTLSTEPFPGLHLDIGAFRGAVAEVRRRISTAHPNDQLGDFITLPPLRVLSMKRALGTASPTATAGPTEQDEALATARLYNALAQKDGRDPNSFDFLGIEDAIFSALHDASEGYLSAPANSSDRPSARFWATLASYFVSSSAALLSLSLQASEIHDWKDYSLDELILHNEKRFLSRPLGRDPAFWPLALPTPGLLYLGSKDGSQCHPIEHSTPRPQSLHYLQAPSKEAFQAFLQEGRGSNNLLSNQTLYEY